MEAADENGREYPLDVWAGIALQGCFAGVNTVAHLSGFMLRTLLDNPEVLARITGERLRELPALRGPVMARSFQHHPVRPRMVNGLVISRLAQRVASVM
ncbi:hypothetical protein, partial [Actinoplanes sp. G11-F43]|uniref:hypothetical protein n=1 Tax=Actinoplanes sp. G11-F43 TaxID=3424130 RepID=UPI003D354A03